MEAVTDWRDPTEDYWNNYENEDTDSEEEEEPKERNSEEESFGLNLKNLCMKDLCNGKEIVFQTDNDFVRDEPIELEEADELDQPDELDDLYSDPICDNSKSSRSREVPVLQWKLEDIMSDMKNLLEDGSILKKIIRSGVGPVIPENAYATVHYNLYMENSNTPFDSTHMRRWPTRIRLGQGQTFLGLDYAIKSMKKNENSLFFINWSLAFGELGCPDRIGKRCNIIADVVLLKFCEIPAAFNLEPNDASASLFDTATGATDFEKRINQAKKMVSNASAAFSKNDIRSAISNYKKALKVLNSLKLLSEEQEEIMLLQKLKCLTNLAICYNKLEKYELACIFCQEALAIDRNSAKANFHYGKASLALSNFKLAQTHLLRANRLRPKDQDIQFLLRKLNEKESLCGRKDETFWKKAFLMGDKELEETCPREEFKKELMSGLCASLDQGKPYAIPAPLNKEEMEICTEVATQLKLHFELKSKFCVFKERNRGGSFRFK